MSTNATDPGGIPLINPVDFVSTIPVVKSDRSVLTYQVSRRFVNGYGHDARV
jgi:hypothetical protein